MFRPALLAAVIALATMTISAHAQEMGGVRLSPEVLGVEDVQAQAFARAFALLQRAGGTQPGIGITAQGAAGRPGVGGPINAPPPDRQGMHQQMIARIRHDPGYLGGFSLGQAQTASRAAPPPAVDPFANAPPPVILNNDGGPVSIDFGNGNIVQQAVTGKVSGTVAQQQTVTIGGNGRPGGTSVSNGGGNVNVATGPNGTAQQQVVTIAGGARPQGKPIALQLAR